MIQEQPLKRILATTREYWDKPATRAAVRQNFQKAIQCRTEALGAEVFVSENEERVVFHTCKARACPSCGHRATEQWQLEQANALPDIPCAMVGLSMPNVLWPIFQRNRRLLHDLPAIGAAAIQQYVKIKYGVRVMVIAIPHTFGRALNFNCHVHVLVSGGGLDASASRWIHSVPLHKDGLMRIWRYAVITYLREALKVGLLHTDAGVKTIQRLLESQYERWWSIHIAGFRSKRQLLRYAGRYVRRPPIAQRRFVRISDQDVEFWTKDLKQKQRVLTTVPIRQFVKNLAEHVPDRYRHAIRYFGLLAPASRATTSAAVFALLGQQKGKPVRRLSWAEVDSSVFWCRSPSR